MSPGNTIAANSDRYVQERYEIQMQEWLEFVWANRDNVKFKTPQTERFKGNFSKGPLGASCLRVKRHYPNGSQYRKTLNTWQLFQAWKESSPSVAESAQKRCYVHYTDAVPEMHAFLDFMDLMEVETNEWKW